MNVDINTAFSFIDVFIVLVLIWAIYKGYKRGPIVHALSLLVIVLAIAVFGAVSNSIAEYIKDRATVSMENLHHYIFIILFLASVWLSNLIGDKIEKSVGAKPKGILNIVLGIIASSLKYLYLLSIFLLYFAQADSSFNILSYTEKRETKLYKAVKNIAPSTIKTVNFLKD